MARKDKRIKTKADYTLAKRHLQTTGGTIYEQDYVTIRSELGEDETRFSNSNFVFKGRPGGNPRKKHTRSKWCEWASNECLDANGNPVESQNKDATRWTLCSVDNSTSTESKIAIKPNYSSLRDFACYGSAVDLIHATVNDIILRFPGSIILTDRAVNEIVNENGTSYSKIPSSIKFGENNYVDGALYRVSNETLVDIDTPGTVNPSSVEYPLKFLQISKEEYVDGNGNAIKVAAPVTADEWCPGSIVSYVDIGAHRIYVYWKDNEKILLCEDKGDKTADSVLARVKDNRLDEFFDTLDDFEKCLLDRDSSPVYKARFETPFMNDYGYYYTVENYTWPVMGDGFTPDLSSEAFKGYLGRLISLASYHDAHDTDNIWRVMTHEAIKNLDWTFVREKNGTVDDLSNIDSSRVEMVLKIYGRMFDDLLRATDNIKASNTISYDEKNNVPDYFLTDVNELAGWELVNTAPSVDSKVTVDVAVEGKKRADGYKDTWTGKTTYNSVDTNIAFLRRLKLNSSYLASLRGTRRGIETMLGLFGMISDERAEKLTELRGKTVTGDYSVTEYFVKASNPPSYDDLAEYNERKDEETGDGIAVDALSGLPVIRTNRNDGKGVIPWFDKDSEYDGGTWFQMNGGWGNVEKKNISLNMSSAKELEESEKVKLYAETLPYMKFADNISSMLDFTSDKVRKNDICYVTNISDWTGATGDSSHYFILRTTAASTTIGKNENGCEGWINVPISSYSGDTPTSDDGRRVLYMESLLSVETGNNPHCGYGEYDMGDEYLARYRQIFKYAIENNWFSSLDKDELEAVKKIGFTLSDNIVDNKKSHWFTDGSDADYFKVEGKTAEESIEDNEDGIYGKIGGKTEDDADMVINVKNLLVKFNETGKDEQFKKDRRNYIRDIVIPFLEQMIPSTTVLKYEY